MTKQMIEVDIPEGFEFVRYGRPLSGEYYIALTDGLPTKATGSAYFQDRIIIKERQPERIIFEKSFEKRQANPGEYYLTADGSVLLWDLHRESYNDYDILTKVEE